MRCMTGHRILHESVVEIASLRLVFLINDKLLSDIRRGSAV